MKLRIIQKGFNYSQDGPGNRLVYHLQGCNMSCPWCANPEGMPMDGVLMPKLSYKEVDIEEIHREILSSRMMFFEDGGVTFTGGEPTMQFEPLLELMKKLKEDGIHVAMENNGSHVRLKEMLPYIDYLMMDFKHPQDAVHRFVTGVSNHTIKENLSYILNSGRQIAIRIPFIHGFNDTELAMEGFRKFFSENPMEHATVEILPYHEYGKDKWEKCGMNYTVTDGYVEPEVVTAFEESLKRMGIQIIHT